MQHKDPKEFIYRRIKLAPIINAAKNDDWNTLKTLLDSGYSLLWYDAKLNASTVKLIKEKASEKLMKELLDYSSQLHGINSEAHQFVLAEAATDPIKAAALAKNQHAVIDPQHSEYPISNSSIFHLYRNNEDILAIHQVKRLWEHFYKFDDIPDAVAAIMRANAFSANGLNRELTLEDLMIKMQAELGGHMLEQHDSIVVGVAIAEAAAAGHEDWAIKQLQGLLANQAPNIEGIFEAAIVCSAMRGQTNFIFKLCEYAKQAKVDQSEKFINSLALAAGAALTKEHYALTKVLMQMVPHFQVRKTDLQELRNWPDVKVERMVRLINDPAISADIIQQAGLKKPASLEKHHLFARPAPTSPTVERVCLQTKKEIVKSLEKTMTGMHTAKTKEAAKALKSSIIDIVNLKELKDFLGKHPEAKLARRCLAIIDKGEKELQKNQKI